MYALGLGAAGAAEAGGGWAGGSIDGEDGSDGTGLPGHREHGEGFRRRGGGLVRVQCGELPREAVDGSVNGIGGE